MKSCYTQKYFNILFFLASNIIYWYLRSVKCSDVLTFLIIFINLYVVIEQQIYIFNLSISLNIGFISNAIIVVKYQKWWIKLIY